MKVIAYYEISGTPGYAVLDQDELEILKGMAAEGGELKITKIKVYRGRH